MSEVDAYKHKCIGIASCPSSYPIVPFNNSHRNVPLYRLDEDALHATSFKAKRGDLLLGGGSGESAALRISIPEAIYFFTLTDWDEYESHDEICQAYWTVTDAYIFGDGYSKLNWNPLEHPLEIWLTEHIVAFILQECSDVYEQLAGLDSTERDGSILRVPTFEEERMW